MKSNLEKFATRNNLQKCKEKSAEM